jgi:hypothetical protein
MLGIMAAAPKRIVHALFADVVVDDDAAPPKRLVPELITDVVVADDAPIFGSPCSALQLLAYWPWKVPFKF